MGVDKLNFYSNLLTMKNLQIKYFMSLVLGVLLIFGCAEEQDDQPVAIDEVVTETINYASDVQVGDHTFKKETTVLVTYNSEGELLSNEVLSKTLDGVEMEQVKDNLWSVSLTFGVNTGSRLPASDVSGPIQTESEDCDTEYDYILTIPNPIGEDRCLFAVEEVCWMSGYDSEGIYTVVMTVDDRYEIGKCEIILQ
ncbi:MAG: hypothetical protein Roseis2KO_48680 [Roseivirga sp.]